MTNEQYALIGTLVVTNLGLIGTTLKYIMKKESELTELKLHVEYMKKAAEKMQSDLNNAFKLIKK